MAGGEGTRLRPLTVNRPKPMVPFCNRPLTEHVLKLLGRSGVRDVVMTLYYLPSSLTEYFGDGSRFGVRVHYSVEDRPLGTAGGVRKASEYLDETFIVISGDVFTNIDLAAMVRYHKRKGALVTMALRRVRDPTPFGIALLDDDGRIVRYLEKPSWEEVFSDVINMGIYVMEPEVLEYIPEGREYDFSKNLFPKLLELGEPIYGWMAEECYWSDIGNHPQYLEAHVDALGGVPGFNLGEVAREVEPGVWVGRGSIIEEGATLIPPVLVGDDVRVGAGARVGPYTVLGDNVIVEGGAVVKGSVVWDHTYVGPAARLTRAIVASKVRIGASASVMEGAVIGDEVVLGKGSVVKPGVKIWPSKIIDPYTVVSQSLKWGIRWRKSLFTPWGITGLANIELTPELAVRLGLAIGSWLGKGSEVAVSRDTFTSSRMIKRALISGLTAAGVDVHNLTIAPLPVLTHYIKSRGVDAGVMVTTPALDPRSVKVKVFDSMGVEIGPSAKKKVQDVIFKEEYRRVLADEVGKIVYPSGFVESYVVELLRHVNHHAIRASGFKVVLDCVNASGSVVAPLVLDRLGVDAVVLNCRTEGDLAPSSTPTMAANVAAVSSIVKGVGADVGFVLDADGDRLVLVDDEGRPLSGDVFLAILAASVAELRGGGVVVVPVSASRVVDKLVEARGGRVVRAGLGYRALVEAVLREGAVLGGDDRGGFVFPEFHMGFDAVMAMAVTLEVIARTGHRLSELAKGVPEMFMVRRSVVFPLEYRGVLMRRLREELREREVDTIDGIKVVEGGGWVFIHPVAHEPLIEVVAEAPTKEGAEVLARQLVKVIEDIRSEVGKLR